MLNRPDPPLVLEITRIHMQSEPGSVHGTDPVCLGRGQLRKASSAARQDQTLAQKYIDYADLVMNQPPPFSIYTTY